MASPSKRKRVVPEDLLINEDTTTSLSPEVEEPKLLDDIWKYYVLPHCGVRDLVLLRKVSKPMQKMIEKAVTLNGNWDDITRIFNVLRTVKGLPDVITNTVCKKLSNGYYKIKIDVSKWAISDSEGRQMRIYFSLNKKKRVTTFHLFGHIKSSTVHAEFGALGGVVNMKDFTLPKYVDDIIVGGFDENPNLKGIIDLSKLPLNIIQCDLDNFEYMTTGEFNVLSKYKKLERFAARYCGLEGVLDVSHFAKSAKEIFVDYNKMSGVIFPTHEINAYQDSLELRLKDNLITEMTIDPNMKLPPKEDNDTDNNNANGNGNHNGGPGHNANNETHSPRLPVIDLKGNPIAKDANKMENVRKFFRAHI